MSTDDLFWLLALLTALCAALGLAGWWIDRWVEKRRPTLPPPSERCLRAGSVERYWRERGEESRHRRRWAA
jgi:hypothetical protein